MALITLSKADYGVYLIIAYPVIGISWGHMEYLILKLRYYEIMMTIIMIMILMIIMMIMMVMGIMIMIIKTQNDHNPSQF
mgnify:CR=1 FL=1